jgi:hypothetical protein
MLAMAGKNMKASATTIGAAIDRGSPHPRNTRNGGANTKVRRTATAIGTKTVFAK